MFYSDSLANQTYMIDVDLGQHDDRIFMLAVTEGVSVRAWHL